MDSIAFEELHHSDLLVDAIYEGVSSGNVGDDPNGKILPVGNQGGFRFAGSVLRRNICG